MLKIPPTLWVTCSLLWVPRSLGSPSLNHLLFQGILASSVLLLSSFEGSHALLPTHASLAWAHGSLFDNIFLEAFHEWLQTCQLSSLKSVTQDAVNALLSPVLRLHCLFSRPPPPRPSVR